MLFKGTPIPATYSWPGLPHDPEIEPLSHDLFSLASLLSLSPMPRLPCSPVPGPATRFQSHQRLSPPPLSASVPFSCSDKLDCITDLPHPMAPSSTHRGLEDSAGPTVSHSVLMGRILLTLVGRCHRARE
jgi:hypothetical protein